MEIQKHLLPIFFIILFILGIYFIVFKKNKEYYENQIFTKLEHFENTSNPNKELIKLAKGIWSTPNTIVDECKVKGQMMQIDLKEEGNKLTGDLYIMNGTDEVNKIPIVVASNKLIVAENNDNHIEFNLEEDKNNINPLQTEKIPMAKVTFYNFSVPIFNSFKIYDTNLVSAKLNRILISKQYLNQNIKEKYDLNTYNKLLKYKYPSNPFIVKYNGLLKKDYENNHLYKKLNNNYYNTIYLEYQREYSTTNDEFIRTPKSDKYKIDLTNSKNYFSEIILKNIEEENKINNIQNSFILKKTYIYFYKKQNNNYELISVGKYFKEKLNFKNNFNVDFTNDGYDKFNFIDFRDTKIKDNSTYNLTLLNTYVMTSNDMDISILPSDFENKI